MSPLDIVCAVSLTVLLLAFEIKYRDGTKKLDRIESNLDARLK